MATESRTTTTTTFVIETQMMSYSTPDRPPKWKLWLDFFRFRLNSPFQRYEVRWDRMENKNSTSIQSRECRKKSKFREISWESNSHDRIVSWFDTGRTTYTGAHTWNVPNVPNVQKICSTQSVCALYSATVSMIPILSNDANELASFVCVALEKQSSFHYSVWLILNMFVWLIVKFSSPSLFCRFQSR